MLKTRITTAIVLLAVLLPVLYFNNFTAFAVVATVFFGAAIWECFRLFNPGTHNAHPVSAAAGIAALRQCRSGQPQEHAAGLAAALRSGLTSALAEAGVPGRAYGESSTFHLLIGYAGEPEQAGLPSLKAAGMSPELSAELHNGMLLEGVHLFHGSGFLSAAHTEHDVERTVTAFAATLARLPAALLS